MKKRSIFAILLIAYIATLIKVMVFKDIPVIKLGQLMINFGGTNSGHAPNFIPFKTIGPYLMGYKGLMIAAINLLGNIILLVPVGFLVPLVFKNVTWKKSFLVSIFSGLFIEIMQVILDVGIFDIDDVILNAIGVMVGYWIFLTLTKWVNLKKYKTIIFSMFVCIAIAASAAYYVYPKDQVMITPEGEISQNSGDPCGGTGGNGEIIMMGNNSITLQRNNESDLLVTFANTVDVRMSAGPGSVSDLKIGERVTLIGGMNPDNTFRADALFVCNEK